MTSINENSTDEQYPSAKYLYDDTKGEYTITNEAEEMNLDNTAEAPMVLDLKGNTYQASAILPSTYQQVEYIENSGTQSIDTGYIPDYTNGFKIECEFSPSILTSRYSILSNYAATNHSALELTPTSNNLEARFYYSNGTIDKKTGTITTGKNKIIIEYANSSMTITANEVATTFSANITGTTIASFIIFSDRVPRYSTFTEPIKIYSCKLYNGNTLIRDFIPCYRTSDNEIGLYDLVNDVFYTNQGTGTFTKGSNVSIPNPDYPQEIHNVSGDNTIEICGKNLFDKDSEDVGYVYSSTGSYSVSSLWNTSDWISVESNTQYALSFKTTGTSNLFFSEFDKNKTFIQRTSTSPLTPQSNTKYVRLSYKNDLGIYDIQLEQGSTSPYEEHKGQNYPINLPVENILDLTSFTTQTSNGITVTPTFENGKLLYLTSSGTYSTPTYIALTNNLTLQPNTQYILTGAYSGSARLRLREFDSNNTQLSEYYDAGSGVSFTTNSNVAKVNVQIVFYATNNVKFYPQIEKGSKANSYTPYGTTPIELCKIGNYQDYIYKEDGKWYLHKEIGKKVLDGSEDWGIANDILYRTQSDFLIGAGTNIFATHFVGVSSQASTTNVKNYNPNNSICCASGGSARFYVKCSDFTSTSDFKTWLSTHNTIVYYVLATPTNTEITDTNLISQLDNIKNNVKSYDTSTHIIQNANDKPFIIKASIFKNTTKGNIEAVKENCKQIENNYATVVYVNDLIGDIDAALDAINGEEI